VNQASLTPAPPDSGLDHRSVGLTAGVALVLGNIVGIGIFLTPRTVAGASANLWMYFGLWVVGGLVAAAGALVYAELGSLFPRAGGEYVFLNKAYGRPVAYAWGWLSAAITFPGSLAALAVLAADTLASTPLCAWLGTPLFGVWKIQVTLGRLLAVVMVWVTTAVNCRSVRLTSWVQLVLTWTPIALFLFAGFWALGTVESPGAAGAATGLTPSLGDMSGAFCAVFFAYSGWSVLVYIGGEVKKPARTIPLAIVLALTVATVIYLLLNLAFVSVTPLAQLATIDNVGVATAQHLFGTTGAEVFAVIMTVAVLACMNVTTMAGSRISLAMARDGYLWKRMARTHPRIGTPVTALLVQASVASVLVLSPKADFLVTFTGSVMVLLSCLTVSSLFIFRERNHVQAPYRSPGYPWIPALFILVGLAVLVAGLTSEWVNMLVGLSMFAGLLIMYRISEYLRARRLLRNGTGS
jgi:APA family basic amino acid/polyamine antiporter